MNDATIRLMSRLGDLLDDDSPFYTPKKANLERAVALTRKFEEAQPVMALHFRAKAYLLLGKPKEALEAAERALAHEQIKRFEIPWSHGWRAASLMALGRKREALTALKKSVGLDPDMAKKAIRRPEFAALHRDRAFLAAVGMPARPTLDEQITRLLELGRGQYYRAYKFGKELLDQHHDRASVLDGVINALRAIVSDLGEHGRANLDDFGGGKVTPATLKKELAKYEARRKKLGKAPSSLANAKLWEAP